SGVVQVSSLNEMIDTLTLLSAARHHSPGAWRVGVLTGLGGECGRASDAADRAGVELPPLSAASGETMKGFLPGFANPRNPLDGTGAMYEAARLFPQLFDVMLREDAIDVVAVNLRVNVPRPGGGAPSRQFSRTMIEALAKSPGRFVVAFSSFAGGDLDQEVVRPLAEAGVPFLESTETAMQALRQGREHRRFLDRRDTAPASAAAHASEAAAHPSAAAPHARPLASRPSAGTSRVLGNVEAMQLLRGFGIPLAETIAAKDAGLAVAAAERLGYPVVLKIDSPEIVTRPTSAEFAWAAAMPPRCAPRSARCSPRSGAGRPRRALTVRWSSAWWPAAAR